MKKGMGLILNLIILGCLVITGCSSVEDSSHRLILPSQCAKAIDLKQTASELMSGFFQVIPTEKFHKQTSACSVAITLDNQSGCHFELNDFVKELQLRLKNKGIATINALDKASLEESCFALKGKFTTHNQRTRSHMLKQFVVTLELQNLLDETILWADIYRTQPITIERERWRW